MRGTSCCDASVAVGGVLACVQQQLRQPDYHYQLIWLRCTVQWVGCFYWQRSRRRWPVLVKHQLFSLQNKMTTSNLFGPH